jgi:hypothetical protein
MTSYSKPVVEIVQEAAATAAKELVQRKKESAGRKIEYRKRSNEALGIMMTHVLARIGDSPQDYMKWSDMGHDILDVIMERLLVGDRKEGK